MDPQTYTVEHLDEFVQECYLDYAVAGIKVGDPLYEWENAHHPTPKCKKGTKTVPLMRKHHAVHGVLQSEVYQHPCISIVGWERPHLPKEYLDLYDKWRSVQCEIGGRVAGKRVVEEQKGIYNPEYRNSEEYKQMLLDNGKKMGEKNGGKAVEEKKGIHSPEYRKSEEYKSMVSVAGGRGGKSTALKEKTEEERKKRHENMTKNLSPEKRSEMARKASVTKFECLVTGHVSNSGGLSAYQRARGIDTSLRVKV